LNFYNVFPVWEFLVSKPNWGFGMGFFSLGGIFCFPFFGFRGGLFCPVFSQGFLFLNPQGVAILFVPTGGFCWEGGFLPGCSLVFVGFFWCLCTRLFPSPRFSGEEGGEGLAVVWGGERCGGLLRLGGGRLNEGGLEGAGGGWGGGGGGWGGQTFWSKGAPAQNPTRPRGVRAPLARGVCQKRLFWCGVLGEKDVVSISVFFLAELFAPLFFPVWFWVFPFEPLFFRGLGGRKPQKPINLSFVYPPPPLPRFVVCHLVFFFPRGQTPNFVTQKFCFFPWFAFTFSCPGFPLPPT